VPSPHAFLVNGSVFFDPHPGKQVEVLDILKRRVLSQEPMPTNVFLWGNRGGGKSRLVRSFLHAVAVAYPGFKYVVVRRNMPDLRLNHINYVGAEMRRLGGDYHDTFATAHYRNGDEKQGIPESLGFFRQCEDEGDAEKIVGAEAAVLFVDEATQIKWDLLRMLGPSLRVPKDDEGRPAPYRPMVIYGGNPVGESTEEIFNYFVDHTVDPDMDPVYSPEDFLAIEFHRKENPSVDETEYRKQYAGLAPHYRKAWLDGVRIDARTLFEVHKTVDAELLAHHGGDVRREPLPPEMEGRPYHYIQELPKIGGVPLLRVPWIQVFRGYDHGFFPDPAACVWLAIVGRRIIAFHEETWFRTIPKDIAAKMIATTTELIGETPVASTLVDPTIDFDDGRVTVMDLLELNGVPCEGSKNDRQLYADAIHSLLGEEVEPGVPRFQVYEPGCPMLAKYLPKMRWDEKNPRRMADHKFDHWIVALAYWAISSGVLSLSAAAEDTREPVWMAWMREDAGQRVRGRRRA
jgi:hypothetical protein